MSNPRDPISGKDLTIADTGRELGPSSSKQITMDPVTMRAGTPPPSSQPRVDAYLGKTLEGRYAVEALLGEGGMGYVYLGRHKLIDKRVAIKILRSDMAADAEMTERFLNEARAASSIGNPHIVDISDFGRLPDGAAYFAMEFLDGVSLSGISGQGRVLLIPRILHIAKQIATGLAAAHARGVVHRDLKPDNIMLIPRGNDRDFVKILDFGIAKLGGESARLTRAGSVFGTPHYMSPEQAAGIPVDQRTDIYSLGVIIYEMATGRVPFDADNFMGILTQHMYKAPAPMRAVAMPGYDVPPGLEAIVVKAISKKPDLRYQSMQEILVDLEKLERGLNPDAYREITSRSNDFNVPADYFQSGAVGSSGSNKAVWGAAAGVAVLVAVIGVAVFLARAPKPSPVVAAQPEPEPVATTIEAPVPPPQPAAPTKVNVLVATDPADALIALDDDPADAPQQAPRAIMVGPDERVNVRVEKAGWKTRKFVLDGKKLDPKNPRAVLRLPDKDSVAKPVTPAPRPAPAAKPTPTPSVAPAPAPAPAPASTVRPASCAVEDWDVYSHKCLKAH